MLPLHPQLLKMEQSHQIQEKDLHCALMEVESFWGQHSRQQVNSLKGMRDVALADAEDTVTSRAKPLPFTWGNVWGELLMEIIWTPLCLWSDLKCVLTCVPFQRGSKQPPAASS